MGKLGLKEIKHLLCNTRALTAPGKVESLSVEFKRTMHFSAWPSAPLDFPLLLLINKQTLLLFRIIEYIRDISFYVFVQCLSLNVKLEMLSCMTG